MIACTNTSRHGRRVLGWRFTMVELMVVMAIISILASMLLPALSRARRRSAEAGCTNNLKMQSLSFEWYADDNNELYPINRPGSQGVCTELFDDYPLRKANDGRCWWPYMAFQYFYQSTFFLCTDPASRSRARSVGQYTVETSYATNDTIPVNKRRRPQFTKPSETYLLGHNWPSAENDPRMLQSMMTGGTPPGAWWPGYHGLRLSVSPVLIAGTNGLLLADGSVTYYTLLEALDRPTYWNP